MFYGPFFPGTPIVSNAFFAPYPIDADIKCTFTTLRKKKTTYPENNT
jgi:hypothetical protein